MYKFTTTERNNDKATEYETKSMLYLFGFRKESKNVEVFIIDCFNDVTGADKAVQTLWDVQSKGVKNLNPKKIGVALITLFQNFLSDIEFKYYILFMPKLKEMYLNDEGKKTFNIDNFKSQYYQKIKQGLQEEYLRRNGVSPQDKELDDFLNIIEFVIADERKMEYIKKITSFQTTVALKEEFYDAIFNEIRDTQTTLKTKNIDGYEIMSAPEVLKYDKVLWKKEIDALVINRMLGMDLFNTKAIPISFIDEIVSFDYEERKDIIQDCQSDIAKVLFDKNGRIAFWKFFGSLLAYGDVLKTQSPHDIVSRMKADKIIVPKIMSEMSVIYLISALEEGMINED